MIMVITVAVVAMALWYAIDDSVLRAISAPVSRQMVSTVFCRQAKTRDVSGTLIRGAPDTQEGAVW